MLACIKDQPAKSFPESYHSATYASLLSQLILFYPNLIDISSITHTIVCHHLLGEGLEWCCHECLKRRTWTRWDCLQIVLTWRRKVDRTLIRWPALRLENEVKSQVVPWPRLQSLACLLVACLSSPHSENFFIICFHLKITFWWVRSIKINSDSTKVA